MQTQINKNDLLHLPNFRSSLLLLSPNKQSDGRRLLLSGMRHPCLKVSTFVRYITRKHPTSPTYLMHAYFYWSSKDSFRSKRNWKLHSRWFWFRVNYYPCGLAWSPTVEQALSFLRPSLAGKVSTCFGSRIKFAVIKSKWQAQPRTTSFTPLFSFTNDKSLDNEHRCSHHCIKRTW